MISNFQIITLALLLLAIIVAIVSIKINQIYDRRRIHNMEIVTFELYNVLLNSNMITKMNTEYLINLANSIAQEEINKTNPTIN
jgi:hypothetical protein